MSRRTSSAMTPIRRTCGPSHRYARAREAQADTLADEMLDIADDGRNDWMERLGRDDTPLGWTVNGEAVQRSRIRLDARKWLAGKIAPKKYGEKIMQEVSGPDGGALQTVTRIEMVAMSGDSSNSAA
ncbi:hypothetical protein AB3X82_07315 [Paraburkholderia phenoliruptrix]|uniref:Uncharacterized protein n=1 Tax=Paraburkholderia phenoliruptrix TaxID=252970 RepID=A0ABV3WG38_9BURK